MAVGDIATRVAASEYVQQALGVKHAAASAAVNGAVPSAGDGGVGGRYDAANPFQGVPSMPRE